MIGTPSEVPIRPTQNRNHVSSSSDGCASGRPDEAPEDLAAPRSLNRKVVELVGGRLHPDAEARALRLLLQPDAVVVVAPDEPEVVLTEPEDGGIVDHAAHLVAQGRVDDLAHRELACITRDRGLHQRFGVGPEDLELPERRQVHHHGVVAARPVLRDRAVVVEVGGQPVARVLDQVAGQRLDARMERRLLREHRLGVGRHAMGDRLREPVIGAVDPNVDVGRIPRVGGIHIVGTRRRCTHEVGHRAQQHVVPGPRPRLVGHEEVVGVEGRVEEEVQRRPPLAGGDRVRLDLHVEVVRAVHVAGIPQVLVVLRVARQGERVVAPDGVADHLDERDHVGVVELAGEPGCRVRVAHERAGDRGVQPSLHAVLQLAPMERQEVGALPTFHVDDLDELAGLHLVARGRGPVDPEVQPGFGQRRRQLHLVVGARYRPPHFDAQVARRRRAVHDPSRRGAYHEHDRAVGRERLRRPGLRPRTEQDLAAVASVGSKPRAVSPATTSRGIVAEGGDQGAEHGGGRIAPDSIASAATAPSGEKAVTSAT